MLRTDFADPKTNLTSGDRAVGVQKLQNAVVRRENKEYLLATR